MKRVADVMVFLAAVLYFALGVYWVVEIQPRSTCKPGADCYPCKDLPQGKCSSVVK